LSRVRICGLDTKVVRSDSADWDADGMGRMNSLTNTITLRRGMDKDVENHVLLHEVIHYICAVNGLPVGDDERQVAVLAASLFAFLRDNNFTAEKGCTEKVEE